MGKTAILEGVPDPEGPDEFWEEEWERHVLTICKAQTRQELGDQCFEAFEQYAIKGRPVEDVARELNLTRNAIYISKSRILARMREIRETLESSG